ncbi:MAG: metallophosphoesterase [Verrucomicrobiae bacterium]|nr:metallophosphoesterase [Verrucomicrobiae bacterium]
MKLSTLRNRISRRTALLALALLLGLRLLTHAATPTTIAVTGDIHTPDMKVVSDVILAHKPLDAVLLVGDTINGKTATLEDYLKIHKGTYDRFKSITFPCPGNHDNRPDSGFKGYCTYWGKIAHPPHLYYSFDLGGWHIISLNSVTFREGKEAASRQLSWLKADLEANRGKPIIAYWHYPYFSRAKHCGDTRMRPLWEALLAHGPALVFCGHNHVYERFPPLDADGNTVQPSAGIQQFVICPGGAKPTEKQKPDATGPLPLVFHAGTHHVGFFVLRPDGWYQFTIKSVDSEGKTAVVDEGSGKVRSR